MVVHLDCTCDGLCSTIRGVHVPITDAAPLGIALSDQSACKCDWHWEIKRIIRVSVCDRVAS